MKLTEQHIDERIDTVDYQRVPGTTTTVCTIKLVNGFVLLGQSACIDPASFDEQTGKDIAYKKARDKIWELEGYLACEARHKATTTSSLQAYLDTSTLVSQEKAPYTPAWLFFKRNVEHLSISDKIQRLWRTPLCLFSQEEKQIISECWNELGGRIEEGRTIPPALLDQVLEIHDRHFVGGQAK